MIRSAVIVALLALVLAACGSSGSKSASTSTAGAVPTVPTNTPQVAKARLQAAQCFRAHGINIPDFTPGGGRIRQALQIVDSYPTTKVQSVLQACASYVKQAFPNATGADLSPAQLAQRNQQVLRFAQCMRAHGINYPDSTNAVANLQALRSLNTSSPAIKSAGSACRRQVLKGG